MNRTSIISLALALVAPLIGMAQTSVTSTKSGYMTTGNVGSNITADGIALDQGGTASLTCPITYYSSIHPRITKGTYVA
jgi:hypothetical protein